MRPTDSPAPRGATGSAQKDKAGEGLCGGPRSVLALPPSWEPPILETQLRSVCNIHHHLLPPSHVSERWLKMTHKQKTWNQAVFLCLCAGVQHMLGGGRRNK